MGKLLDDTLTNRAAVVAAATSSASFDSIERPRPFDASAVDVRCAPLPNTAALPGGFTITRAVERALYLRAPELIGADTTVTPTFDGRGLEITRAGPGARSCGFEDGDMLVEINGVSTSRGDALVAVPAQVSRDGLALFRVVRGGSPLEWRVLVEGRR